MDRERPDVVQLLLDVGADVNPTYEAFATVDPKPTTPLWLAMHSSARTLNMCDEGIGRWIEIIDILVT